MASTPNTLRPIRQTPDNPEDTYEQSVSLGEFRIDRVERLSGPFFHDLSARSFLFPKSLALERTRLSRSNF